MRNTVLFILLFSTLNIYAQNKLLITYNLHYKPSKDFNKFEDESFYLQIDTNSKTSIFKSIGQFKADSILNGSAIINLSFFKTNQSRFTNTIFYNYSTKILGEDNNFGSQKLKYEIENFKILWDLVAEQKTINSYKVSKAECELFGRKWIAWYTVEIPIQEGPYKFKGLPGLILQISDSKNEYNYNFSGLSKNLDLKIISPPSKIITHKEFLDAKIKLKNNPYSSIPGFEILEGNIKKTIEEKFKMKEKLENNPIE
ncbi:GLPGLI family protein [Halpernia sp.]|uniref:GLPGLI family protein n=1 Tax=Halpernia sp. TaxID=2782209 RepID=UPI003A95CC55